MFIKKGQKENHFTEISSVMLAQQSKVLWTSQGLWRTCLPPSFLLACRAPFFESFPWGLCSTDLEMFTVIIPISPSCTVHCSSLFFYIAFKTAIFTVKTSSKIYSKTNKT